MKAQLILFPLAICCLGTVKAATYSPTRLDDPVPSACTAQDCSLRSAVLAANANPGFDDIALATGTYSLSRGELQIADALEIVGGSVAQTRIDAGGLSVIAHALENVALTMRKVSLEGPPLGRISSMLATPDGSVPTAIKADGGAPLTLDAMRVTPGGGIVQLLDASAAGDLIVTGSDLWYLQSNQRDGSIALIDSDLQYGYLGTSNVGGSEVDINILRSMIAGDDVGASGLVIETRGSVRIAYSDVADTSSGMLFQATSPSEVTIKHLGYRSNLSPINSFVPLEITISDSEFSDNIATLEDPAAIIAGRGGHWRVSGCAFINNRGNGDLGGAILVEGFGATEVIIENSTFSGNTFSVGAASASARGAAIGVRGSAQIPKLTLRHVTMVAPVASPAGIEGSLLGIRGADNQSSVTARNTILRGSCGFPIASAGFDVASGNIESTANTCLLNGATNIVSAAASALVLGSLATHAGWTRNYLPGNGSIVIDAGQTAGCLATDQRHYLRPAGSGCDVGSIETSSISDVIFNDEFE